MANNRAQDVEIRPARDGDIYELSQLRLEALRTEPIAFSRDYEADSRQSPEDWAAWFHERSDGANGAIFVADAAGKLAGMAGIARERSPKLRHNGFMWGVYVQPGYRRGGAGRRLSQACVQMGARTGRRSRSPGREQRQRRRRTPVRGVRFPSMRPVATGAALRRRRLRRADDGSGAGTAVVLLTPEQALTLREWFLPDQPGPLVGLHVLNTGNGTLLADRWPEPRTVLAGAGGNYTLLGDPRALRPADLQPHVRGYLNTTEALVPLLLSAFPDAKPWARVVLALHASSKPIAIGEHDVRRLGRRDAHYVAQLGADSAWISMTWGGPSGLASSGYAWGAFAAGRLVSVACTFFLGQTLEDIGVVTEPDFRAGRA